jgi:hypothetical protein
MFITILCLIESSVQLDSMIYQLAIPPILAQMPRSTFEATPRNRRLPSQAQRFRRR